MSHGWVAIHNENYLLKKENYLLKKENEKLKAGPPDSCDHEHECGCGKPSCQEMDGEDCDDPLCSNEGCRHYYDHRNDNCDCCGDECLYCKYEDCG